MESLDDLLIAARAWREHLAGLVVPASLPGAERRADALEALRNVERRIEEGPAAPVRVAFFGPTGAGKSKLFNSLIGEQVSPAGYLRPCTRRPIYYLHEKHSGMGRRIDGEVKLHGREAWAGLVLIDTPDFDSVEEANRSTAERIYLEADSFIFVTDVHKYADASAWSYLKRLAEEGKRCGFVLNKVEDSSAPAADLQLRLAEVFSPALSGGGPHQPVTAVADRPQRDEDLLPADDPGLAEVRRTLEDFLGAAEPVRARIRVESLRIDLRRFLRAWDDLSGPLRAFRGGLDRISAAVEDCAVRSRADLGQDLEERVDPALKEAVYREVLRRIDRIDILRYPRKLLALPWTGARELLRRYWPGFGQAVPAPAQPADPADAANFAAIERRIQEFTEAVVQVLRAEPACPGILDDEKRRELRLGHDEIRERFESVEAEFKGWVESQAHGAAAALTTDHKLKFFLSQLIFNTVVIGVQVKTAGMFTLAEAATAGVLSPLVAKAVGMAVSSDTVRTFEGVARREHTRRVGTILDAAQGRFLDHLRSLRQATGPLDDVAPGVEALRAAGETLLARWSGGGTP